MEWKRNGEREQQQQRESVRERERTKTFKWTSERWRKMSGAVAYKYNK